MSIPPLVCSTPPPPDQCEDDKDPDDFDISYNLSQDDDDDEFNYGDFSSYNHYQSNCMAQQNEALSINIHVESVPREDKEIANVIQSEEDHEQSESENKPKCDEDTNIEDLGLEVIEESLSSNEKDDEKSEIENYVENSDKVLEVTDDASDENNTQSSPSEENVVRASSVDQFQEILDDPIDDSSIDLDVLPSEPNSSNDEFSKNDDIKEINQLNATEGNLDDDFGDYDDFQYVSSERKPSAVIENCDNPWDTNDETDNNDFGNFTANFDAIESQNCPNTMSENIVKDNLDLKSSIVNEDDDFGDFDDFKSSSVGKTATDNTEELECDQNLPVLNFTSDNEHQIMESITKVLSTIFEVELTEPETEFEGNLESTLSETWRHLRETDVRQPYILNWNNSLGQKTLLKALCIDSRNILFGPKWSYNMPKYAVNLGVAPLQPQKPLTPSNSLQSEAANKTLPKPAGWIDPFTADGQESCSTEKESVVEVTATDLDVFEAAITKKSDKIYSSTLAVQPLRQISLPDTHIFTPTDSETPTSKTVHYSNGPPILLPQTTLDSSKTNECSSIELTNNTPDVDKDDDDYWEFQDFKSSSEKTSTTSTALERELPPETAPETKIDNVAPKPNVTYQTQVLQPIRMEPLMPTVNWPDPGEIKETFDNFTDFVSSWNDNTQIPTPPTKDKKLAHEIETLVIANTKHKNYEEEKETPTPDSKDMDDDFDTFQSALPTKHITTSEYNFDKLGITSNNIPQVHSSQIPDFNTTFSNINIAKSENISANNQTQSNTPETSSYKISISGNASHNNLLQPLSAPSSSTSQIKQKTGQILQPLSLESYSQINWPNPGIDLQDLSRFNPVETLHSLKNDVSVGGASKGSSPVHSQKNVVNTQVSDDDWGDFVSSKPKQATVPKKPASFVDDDEWTDFVSSPNVKPQNGLNTISLNVHTNSNIQKTSSLNKLPTKSNQTLDIPSLNYITPKTSGNKSYNDRHFQNL